MITFMPVPTHTSSTFALLMMVLPWFVMVGIGEMAVAAMVVVMVVVVVIVIVLAFGCIDSFV